MTKGPELQASNITKNFETPAGTLRILDNVSLELAAGSNLAVIGPSGSGKSTFLHIIGTLDSPTSGTVNLFGKDPSSLDEAELANFRNSNIGFVFQEHHLLPQLTALENVMIPAAANGRAGKEAQEHASDLLKRVGLEDRVTHRPGELSGGERQRVAVARALLNRPGLLLADEPTGSLDHSTGEVIGQLLLDLQKQDGFILVCVTHNDHYAATFDRKVRLEDGIFIEL